MSFALVFNIDATGLSSWASQDRDMAFEGQGTERLTIYQSVSMSVNPVILSINAVLWRRLAVKGWFSFIPFHQHQG
jgi:hypothetical protein